MKLQKNKKCFCFQKDCKRKLEINKKIRDGKSTE